MRQEKRLGFTIMAGLLGLSMNLWVAQAGSLTPPPGPIAPTMKTLEEVEPRIPIHASDIPLTITDAGSYYLTENLTSNVTAITIAASHVTLDLRDYALDGTGVGDEDGIYIPPEAYEDITIRNGTIRNWGGSGLLAEGVEDLRLIDLVALDNGHAGLLISSGSITRCLAAGNGWGGLYLYTGSISHSVARGNGEDGIVASHAAVTDCLADNNEGSGIVAGDSTVTRCRVRENGQFGIAARGSTVIGCLSHRNTGDGIEIQSGGGVRDSVAVLNRGHGFTAINASLLQGNTSIRNGWGGDAAGIYVSGDGNRIEGNHVKGNDRGIEVDGLDNVIVRNSATVNTTNYDIVAGNDIGPLGTAATATSAWANIDN
jgi:parallel beta-helix repeat protein